MQEFLKQISEEYFLKLSKSGSWYHLALPRRGDYGCELRIGPRAMKWYVSIRQASSKEEVASDWMDYLGYDDTPERQLLEIKKLDILWFVEHWILAANVLVETYKETLFFRIHERKKYSWLIDGVWDDITMQDIHVVR